MAPTNTAYTKRIERLLVLSDQSDLCSGCNICHAKVLLIEEGINRTLHLALEDLGRLESLEHGADCSQTTSDISLGLGELRNDLLGKVEEECLSLLGALTLVSEGKALICATRELDEVEAVGLELLAKKLAVVGGKAAILKLNTVDLDGQAEGLGNTGANGICDLEDDASTVLNLVQEFGSMGKALDNILEILLIHGLGLSKVHSHHITLELHVAGRDWVLLNVVGNLASRMADLGNHQASVFLAHSSHFLESIKSLARSGSIPRDNGVTGSLEMVILDHDVSSQDDSIVSLAPASVNVDELW
ncbi:hypothetical protein HG530_012235 [Fusarium avenaceum]|nr:hypothetical protein HG530_012235 [Fusarium avenaceum]